MGDEKRHVDHLEEAARKAKEAEPKAPTTEELLSEILAELRKKE